MAQIIVSVYVDEATKRDLDVMAGVLGYTVSSYSYRAIQEAIAADKKRFPKAFEAAKAAQEEVQLQRGA